MISRDDSCFLASFGVFGGLVYPWHPRNPRSTLREVQQRFVNAGAVFAISYVAAG
jgi:hypothetical protein